MTVIEASHSDHKSHSLIGRIIGGLFLVAGLYVTVTLGVYHVVGQEATSGRGNVVEARLGKGTESLLKQLAIHMSKLLGGESIGGFPGFEPPDDDEAYKRKIINYSYSSEEANYWIKEINNILKQLTKRNPNMTLEKILQQIGSDPEEIRAFMNAIRAILGVAESWENRGVDPSTIATLRSLIDTLGVQSW